MCVCSCVCVCVCVWMTTFSARRTISFMFLLRWKWAREDFTEEEEREGCRNRGTCTELALGKEWEGGPQLVVHECGGGRELAQPSMREGVRGEKRGRGERRGGSQYSQCSKIRHWTAHSRLRPRSLWSRVARFYKSGYAILWPNCSETISSS